MASPFSKASRNKGGVLATGRGGCHDRQEDHFVPAGISDPDLIPPAGHEDISGATVILLGGDADPGSASYNIQEGVGVMALGAEALSGFEKIGEAAEMPSPP